MKDDAHSPDARVTGAEIARLAGVTRAAVSNWRRRYHDFPDPVGGGPNAPLFSLSEVRTWLAEQRKGQEVPDEVRLWQALRGSFGDSMISGLAAVAQLLTEGDAPALDAALADLTHRLAASESPRQVVDGLAERYQHSGRRSGSDQTSSPRLVKAVGYVAGRVPPDATIFDPACGIGSLLLSVGPHKGPVRRGQEVDANAARFAQARAELTGSAGAVIEVGDSLRTDRWPKLRADLVVCDPPVAVPDWGREELLLDARWELGIPSRAESELAWLQHCYAHTAPGGRALVVLPASVAYRKAGRRIRAELVRRGVLTQVVALPAGMVASHAMPVHLWTLRRPLVPAEAPAPVRMIDLTANDPDGPWEPRPGQMTEVAPVQLLNDVVDLTPGSHVRASRQDYPAEYAALRREIEDRLRVLATLLPALEAGGGPSSLDRATVGLADLSRGGLVEFGEDGPASVSDQLDTEYLRGFLRSASNTRRATSGSGTFRLDARGSRVPQMPLDDQRRYGVAFRALREFEELAKRVAGLGERAASLARDGLTNGALTPRPDEE
ncbi:N-6 DNA methylase [Streptomyces litchfieldiae]|uniref:N-6 DNA methylase n=1 Tax=Streptomyces litchfieldiae TaxID=3075543 RepID=A0ABU2MPT0_9ACTN|nr:N-6 DNA methylase [Streptomyces sp. DSM 44938]MDT0343515.1 N-6 DNA methylase [Streptomyces sp. DSM 44938]